MLSGIGQSLAYAKGPSRVRPGSFAGAVRARAIALVVLMASLLVVASVILRPQPAFASVVAGADDDAAVDAEAGLGITGFTRYQRGADRPVDDVDLGYRFPLPADASVVAVATQEAVVVYVDPAAAERAGISLDDAEQAQALLDLVVYLDESHSRGGDLLVDWMDGRRVVVTTESSLVEGAYRIDMACEVGGRPYCSVVPASVPEGQTPSEAAQLQGIDLSEGVLWCDGGALVPAGEVAAAVTPGPLEQLAAFLADIDLRPFWVSLKTSAVALVITFVLGLLAAWRTMGVSSRLKGILDSLFTIPMVLPPTVCGFLLLLLFGQATPIGQWLIAQGISLVFTWQAAVISAVVVSFPLMYRTALGAFESLDATMLDAARTLGWSEGRIFCRLMLPLAWPSIAAGTVLAFARAMGEFGCTLFFAGNYAGVTQTIPIAIYFEWMSGNTDVALFWVIVVILFSFVVVLFINVYTARSQRFRERGGVRARGSRARRAAADDTAWCAHEAAAPDHGGDVLRIDADALRALMRESAAPRQQGGAS